MGQRICLNMIVKNEAHVIERCLRSVRPFIHSWAIADTGSSDGTQDIVRRIFADVPGELIERPWLDFAHNRNEALQLARRYGDYALLMDADDVLEYDAGFTLPALQAPAYSVEFLHEDTRYFRTLLARLDIGWYWRGVLHETLVSPDGAQATQLRGLRVRERREGARSQRPPQEKYGADAEVLRRALEREPDNSRYVFYLAQSLRDAGQFAAARAAYAKRAAMGGWDEDIYYSKLQIAVLLERERAAESEVTAAYLDAYQFRPSRAESLCYLAKYCRESQRYAVALLFARVAVQLPYPSDILFVDASVYEWRARDELAVAAYWCGERELSAQLCRDLLDDARLPAEQRDRVRKNLAFAEGA
jgi:glycosyltransferase involved in cell wall biosynthesis